MASPEDALDDLLAEPAAPSMPEDIGDDEPAPTDEFGMHAADFLDDSLPLDERIEALRSAIMAAGASPLE